jgi:hypothetical protein
MRSRGRRHFRHSTVFSKRIEEAGGLFLGLPEGSKPCLFNSLFDPGTTRQWSFCPPLHPLPSPLPDLHNGVFRLYKQREALKTMTADSISPSEEG